MDILEKETPWKRGLAIGEHLARVGVVEGGLPDDHLEEEDPKGPPVDHEAVGMAAQELGRDAFDGAAEGRELLFAEVDACLGEAHVRDDNVSVGGHKDVAELEVSMADGLLVHVLEREEDLDAVEAGALLGEALGLGARELVLETAPGEVVRDDVAVGRVLEGEAAVQRERRPAAEGEDLALLLRALLQVRPAALLDRLDGEEAVLVGLLALARLGGTRGP